MNFIVLDTEGDGLAYDCTKLHVLSYTTDGKEVHSTPCYKEMRGLLETSDTMFVCHNSLRHDQVALHRIAGVPMDYTKWVDTLSLSWVLFPDRVKHGLAEWGEEFGVPKPKVDDWEGLTYEQYRHRCSEDTKITYKLWMKCKSKLERLYNA